MRKCNLSIGDGEKRKKIKKDGCLKFLIWDGGEKGQNIPRKMTEEEECSSSPFPPRGGARGEGDVAENIQSHLPQLLPPTFASPLPPPFGARPPSVFIFCSSHTAAQRGGRGRNKSRRGLKCTQSSEEGDWKSNNDCRSLFEFRTQRILLLPLRLCVCDIFLPRSISAIAAAAEEFLGRRYGTRRRCRRPPLLTR